MGHKHGVSEAFLNCSHSKAILYQSKQVAHVPNLVVMAKTFVMAMTKYSRHQMYNR